MQPADQGCFCVGEPETLPPNLLLLLHLSKAHWWELKTLFCIKFLCENWKHFFQVSWWKLKTLFQVSWWELKTLFCIKFLFQTESSSRSRTEGSYASTITSRPGRNATIANFLFLTGLDQNPKISEIICLPFKLTLKCCVFEVILNLGQVLTAMEQKFHPACFRCGLCDIALEGVPFLISGGSVSAAWN